MDLTIILFGWAGAVLVLLAYALVSRGTIKATAPTFQLMNLVGAVALGVQAAYSGIWSMVLLNAVWFVVALVTIIKLDSDTPST